MKKQFNLLAIPLLAVLLATACNPTSQIAGTETTLPDSREISAENLQNLALSDYLRRIPGLRVESRGSDVKIYLRGSASFNGESSPLFIIDKNQVGHDYNLASSMVDSNDIASVRLLQITEATSMYGMRGANGAIVIKTKTK
jgi:TonB-dependent SusC/RagA subfamily outer membrane receptor